MIPIGESFIDKTFGFVEKCDVTRLNALYAEMVNTLFFDGNGAARTARGQMNLWSEIWKPKTGVKGTYAPQCSSGLLTFKFHLLDHVVRKFDVFRSPSFTDAALLEHL